MVPGIGPSPDKMLIGRLFSYPDTHRYPDRSELPAAAGQPPAVPCPQLQQGRRDALRGTGDPVYAPNTAGGPAADEARYGEQGTWHASGDMVRAAYDLHSEDDDFGQPGTLVREIMSQEDRDHLARRTPRHAGISTRNAGDEAAHRHTGSNVDRHRGPPWRGGCGRGVARSC